MQEINCIELFGGIRAPYKSFLNLHFKVKTIAYIENDPKVVSIANAMYGTNYIPQSVIDWHYEGNEPIHVLCGGSPCQSFSLAGLQLGGEKDSGTPSSLIWEQLRILKETMPYFYIWENVKNVLSKKHKSVFDKHNDFVESLGYKIYWKVLNAKDYGIPQNRERVFVIAIRNDIENDFNFDNSKTTLMKPLKEFLQTPRLKDYIYKDKQKYIAKRIQEQKLNLNNYLENVDTWYYIKNKTEWFVNRLKPHKEIGILEREREETKEYKSGCT